MKVLFLQGYYLFPYDDYAMFINRFASKTRLTILWNGFREENLFHNDHLPGVGPHDKGLRVANQMLEGRYQLETQAAVLDPEDPIRPLQLIQRFIQWLN